MIDGHEWGPGSAGAIDFGARMGRRRFTQCILRCEDAINSGALENARIALDEARELIPHAPEIAVLDGRMNERRDGNATTGGLPVPSVLPLPFEGEDDDIPASDEFARLSLGVASPFHSATSFERGRALLLTILPIAVVLVATGVLGFGLWPVAATRSPAAPLPLKGEGGVVASLRPTRIQPRPLPFQPRTLREASVQETAVATTGELRARSVDPRAAGDDEEIRAVLKRYQSAYNRLNENDRAASLISRGAEREVVERNPSAPPSGLLSFGVCDITRAGGFSVATCAATSASEPSVDGSTVTTRWLWAFDLRKAGDGWRLEHLNVE